MTNEELSALVALPRYQRRAAIAEHVQQETALVDFICALLDEERLQANIRWTRKEDNFLLPECLPKNNC